MSERVWCLDVFLFDFFKVVLQKKMWWFTAFNYKKVILAIQDAQKYLNMNDAILVLQNPMAIGVAKKLRANRFVFDAIDNWLYHPQMPDKSLIRENYDFVDKNADLVMTVSQALMNTFPYNNNVHWIPNGVDVDFFSNAIKNVRDHNIVVGYVGKIQDRIDFELVEECLIKFPYAQFVFMGPVYSQINEVNRLRTKYKNIMFKGDIHYENLPNEMRCFDITIIPHKVDQFTESMNPLKLYEYLASGKPVISTGVAGISSISKYVFVAENSKQFVDKLDELITNISDIDARTIIDSIPSECFWRNRTSIMLDLMSESKDC